MKFLIKIFFFILLLFGESFKILNYNVSLLIFTICIIWFFVENYRNKVVLPALSLQYFFLISLIYLIIGFSLHSFLYVIEDFLPLFCFFFIHWILINYYTRSEEYYGLVLFIMIVSSISVIKVLLINFTSIDPQWGGNTFWQASKTPLSGFFNRVILKGTDIYIVLSVLFFFFYLKQNKTIASYIFFSLSSLGVLFSFTRTSILILIVIILFVSIQKERLSLDRIRKFVLGIGIVIIFYSLLSITGFQNAFQERANQGTDESSLSWRQLESFLALNEASEKIFLGNGFGTHFDMFLSGSNKQDEVSLYVHNLYVWFILKCGIFGLLVFIFVIIKFLQYLRKLGFYNKFDLLHSFVKYSFVFLLINDFINNKFSTLSGSIIYGILISIPAKLNHEV